MDDEDVAVAYQELRLAVEDMGMAWLLDELDEATSVGVIEVKPLRQRTVKGVSTYQELTLAERTGPGRKRAEEFLSRRPMTAREQVDGLLDAVDRVLVGLDEVAAASVLQLQDLPVAGALDVESSIATRTDRPRATAPRSEAEQISEIDFASEDLDTLPITTEQSRHSTARAEEIHRIILAIRSEVAE